MLVNLHVKNLALIEEENIDFDEGLNILSGETGAGKSIILGSINAALGSKTSPDFIRSGCEYGLSEITFAIPEDKIERIKELGVISCDDGELVISRKIMANRSQIKVNGQSFTSAQTRVLAHELIDIHGQHDNQLLMDESNHLSVIDAYDNSIIPLLDSYKDCYKEYAICRKAYESLSGDDESRIKEMAFLQYEINELESAALKPGDHGSTYGGNPMAGCACKTVFKIIEENNILEHVQDVSEYLIEKLDELVEKYDVIKERRGLGLMIGLEFTNPVKPYIQKALDKGLIFVSAGNNVIRMLPPFIIEEKHVDEMIEILSAVIEEVNG